MTQQAPARPVEIDVAALYLARTYGGGDTTPAALKRWSIRIRVWANRCRDGILEGPPVHCYGKAGRRGIYCLDELDTRAQTAVSDIDG